MMSRKKIPTSCTSDHAPLPSIKHRFKKFMAKKSKQTITAYKLNETPGWTITPAPWSRQWMDETPGKGAYRCLPLTMANQAGWVIRSPFSFTAEWDGSPTPGESIQFHFDDQDKEAPKWLQSHFGNGIITFRLPFLFRTPPGIGLLVRGMPNYPIVNFSPLEGLVETDWTAASFTMNWKITESKRQVIFSKEDPVCFIQPFDLALPEQLEARSCDIDENPKEKKQHFDWKDSRNEFLRDLKKHKGGWQKNYYKGLNNEGKKSEHHRTNFQLSLFDKSESPSKGDGIGPDF